MAVIGIILSIAGFFGYIACLTIGMHFEYKSCPKEEECRREKITNAARKISRLCLAAFTLGLIMFSAFLCSFG